MRALAQYSERGCKERLSIPVLHALSGPCGGVFPGDSQRTSRRADIQEVRPLTPELTEKTRESPVSGPAPSLALTQEFRDISPHRLNANYRCGSTHMTASADGNTLRWSGRGHSCTILASATIPTKKKKKEKKNETLCHQSQWAQLIKLPTPTQGTQTACHHGTCSSFFQHGLVRMEQPTDLLTMVCASFGLGNKQLETMCRANHFSSWRD